MCGALCFFFLLYIFCCTVGLRRMSFSGQVELQPFNEIVYFVRYFKYDPQAESEIPDSREKDFEPG